MSKKHLWTFATKWCLWCQNMIPRIERWFLLKWKFCGNLQACTLSKQFDLQWVVHHWKIHYSSYALGNGQKIDVVLKKLMTWPMGDKMQGVMMEFKNWCGMSNVMNVIDNTHIAIIKPFNAIAKNYYYHKTINYNIVTQVVVDN